MFEHTKDTIYTVVVLALGFLLIGLMVYGVLLIVGFA